jgi:hypothetical protein
MDKDAGSCVIGHRRIIVTSAVPGGTCRSTHPYPARIPQRASAPSEMYRAIFRSSLAGLGSSHPYAARILQRALGNVPGYFQIVPGGTCDSSHPYPAGIPQHAAALGNVPSYFQCVPGGSSHPYPGTYSSARKRALGNVPGYFHSSLAGRFSKRRLKRGHVMRTWTMS